VHKLDKELTNKIISDLDWLRNQLVEDFDYLLSTDCDDFPFGENPNYSFDDYSEFKTVNGLSIYFNCGDVPLHLEISARNQCFVYADYYCLTGLAIQKLIMSYKEDWESSAYDALHAAGIELLQNVMPEDDVYEIDEFGKIVHDEYLKFGISKNPNLFFDLLVLSNMTYEREFMNANILFTSYANAISKKGDFSIWIDVPISIKNYRLARKLIEISSDELYIVCTQSHILGFINVQEANRFHVRYRGKDAWNIGVFFTCVMINISRSKWNIYLGHHGVPPSRLFIYNNGLFQQNEKQHSDYIGELKSLFPECNITALTDIITSARTQAHGTMIVVSEKAKDEVIRLSHCCIPIVPACLDSLTTKYITAIDGALIIDPNGICYAIGAILDGEHKQGNGENIDRGARHNSARRYTHWVDSKCLILTVSEDGDVTVIKANQ